VAELIADAFATELDERGAAALREMRVMARLGGLLNVINVSGNELDDFFGGFVWEEEGKIIGNITVQRADKYGARWQIANVAVAPTWRGRGISRKLMETALEHVRSHGGKWAVLQVYAENAIAYSLYQRLGFEVVGGVTDMEAPRTPKGVAPPSLPNLRPFGGDDWQQLYDLANSQSGGQSQWWRPLRRSDFQISFEQQVSEWAWKTIGRRQHFRTAILPGNTPLGRKAVRFEAAAVLTVERWNGPHKLQLLVRPQWWGSWEQGLVDWALNLLTPYPVWKIITSIPHDFDAARNALATRGFLPLRTLLTMKLDIGSAGGQVVPPVGETLDSKGASQSVELADAPQEP
jgi:ribosomal protein S18 acetylase RimI-like enzyme